MTSARRRTLVLIAAPLSVISNLHCRAYQTCLILAISFQSSRCIHNNAPRIVAYQLCTIYLLPLFAFLSGCTTQMAASSQNPGQKFSAAALAALLSFSSVAGPLLVLPDAAHAARSGGRAGGSRSFSSRPAPARAPAARAPAARAPPARVNTNTNYAGGGGSVRYVPSPVMGFGFSPFGYSPFGGIGTGYALGSMANSGQRYETNRLESEV